MNEIYQDNNILLCYYNEKIAAKYYRNGAIYVIQYFNIINEFEKENNLNFIEYNLSSNTIIYYENSVFHNLNGPAILYYNEDNNISALEYWRNGEIHNAYGPAAIGFYEDGYVNYHIYYYKGNDYDEDVNNWLIENKLKYTDMKREDFNRMWMEIL